MQRREFFALAGAAVIAPHALTWRTASMYGLIGKMSAVPGKRDALTAILLESTEPMQAMA